MLGPKEPTFRSPKWLRNVAELECVCCGAKGTQAAHRNMNKGMSLKTDDCLTAALCPTCHTELDQGKDLDREERRQRLDMAIMLTLIRLARRGKIKAC